jgi:hypothetical protein
MTQLGNFRDDYYNAAAVLTNSSVAKITTALSGTVLTAAQLSGAQDQYLNISGQTAAQTATTDTAANIVANLLNAVATAQASPATFPLIGSGAQGNPPAGVPNLFNFTYTLSIVNSNVTAGTLTLTAGAGVTFTGSNVVVFGTSATAPTTAIFVVTVTSPTSVNFNRAQ